MIVTVEYLIPRSRRPEWLLKYIQEIKCLYTAKDVFGYENTISNHLDIIKEVLKDIEHKSRTLVRRAYDIVETQIEGNILTVSTCSGNPLVKISMELSSEIKFVEK